MLNTGGSSNVVGFRLEGDHLNQIDHSLAFLSTNTAGAASIAISPDGQFVAVTERLTNSVDVFKVLADGTLAPIVINPSVGPGAFSVSFTPNGEANVSETGGARRIRCFFLFGSSLTASFPNQQQRPNIGSCKLLERDNPGRPLRLCVQCGLINHLGICHRGKWVSVGASGHCGWGKIRRGHKP